MNFAELIRQRYSVRAYKPVPVPDELLAQVLEAGRLAPTAANKQPFRIIVIHTKGREVELRRIYHRDWFTQAPLILCVCTVRAEAWKRAMYDGKSHADVDATIVMDHLIMAATDLGLGTCWIAAFDPAAAREALGVPPEVEPVLFTPLGFPADQPKLKERRSLAELARYERW
jgi:nitroreductase